MTDVLYLYSSAARGWVGRRRRRGRRYLSFYVCTLNCPTNDPVRNDPLFVFKVVVSLSPCFRGDFPESVTDDRYMTSE